MTTRDIRQSFFFLKKVLQSIPWRTVPTKCLDETTFDEQKDKAKIKAIAPSPQILENKVQFCSHPEATFLQISKMESFTKSPLLSINIYYIKSPNKSKTSKMKKFNKTQKKTLGITLNHFLSRAFDCLYLYTITA